MPVAAGLSFASKIDRTSTGEDVLGELLRLTGHVGRLSEALPSLKISDKYSALKDWADGQLAARNLKVRIQQKTLTAMVILRVSPR